ncbi:MAG: hypothetical protein AAGK05_16105, partial [Pseudomonadota bacterium]
MDNIPSLTKPPTAPKKKKTKRPLSKLGEVKRRLFPNSPPPAPRKKMMRRHICNRPPIILEWDDDQNETEAKWLANSGQVRIKFLTFDPTDVKV